MLSEGQVIGDGSWKLRVCITDIGVERYLRVKGDMHVGGVMLRLVEELDLAMDWSDHALWWPDKNVWLTRTRSTLDQAGVQADSFLHFTPMHKTLRLQLPDLRYLDCRVDFSIKTFNAVMQVCKELGIRHPEELSLCKPLEPAHLKSNYVSVARPKAREARDANSNHLAADTNTFIATNGKSPSTPRANGSNGSLDRGPFLCAPLTPSKQLTSTPVTSPPPSLSPIDILENQSYASLANTPRLPGPQASPNLLKPKSLVEKARMNVAWLDSSLSIMEQGVRELDTLHLRFKFYSFYDLNPKVDAVRINQIYQQAKWQILNEELDCTEEEAFMFAGLQLQVELQASVPQPALDSPTQPADADDDIDAALSELQLTLEGSHVSSSPGDITHVPELHDYLRFLKPKRFTLKAFKRYWFTCRDMTLSLYKSAEEWSAGAAPLSQVSLLGCEVTPELSLAQNKYGIKLEVPGPDGMTELYIRCESEEQYAKWLAACRLAAKGRSLADSSYQAEVASIATFLQLQHPAAPAIPPQSLDISPDLFLPNRTLKKARAKAPQRILEAHANVKDLALAQAKLNYIKAWQSLPDFGISLFLVKFQGCKKEELLGITYNKLMKMDLSGDHIKTWRYASMKAWNVNWEVRHMMVQFDDENIVFRCLSADCKVIHEFIGGYLFLSMRSKEANQALNEELFHKLTGGWV